MAKTAQNGEKQGEKGAESAQNPYKTGYPCHEASGTGKAAQDLERSERSETAGRAKTPIIAPVRGTFSSETFLLASSGTYLRGVPTTLNLPVKPALPEQSGSVYQPSIVLGPACTGKRLPTRVYWEGIYTGRRVPRGCTGGRGYTSPRGVPGASFTHPEGSWEALSSLFYTPGGVLGGSFLAQQ